MSPRSSSLAEELEENLQTHLFSMFNDPKFSDFTVTCKGRTWFVHRALLAERCDFFRAVCESGFKESHEQTVALQDDDPEVVHILLQHLYTNDPELVEYADSPTEPSIEVFFMDIFKIAAKYNLPLLAKQVVEAVLGWSASPDESVEEWNDGIFCALAISFTMPESNLVAKLRHALASQLDRKALREMDDKTTAKMIEEPRMACEIVKMLADSGSVRRARLR